jgi:hypothetical protein
MSLQHYLITHIINHTKTLINDINNNIPEIRRHIETKNTIGYVPQQTTQKPILKLEPLQTSQKQQTQKLEPQEPLQPPQPAQTQQPLQPPQPAQPAQTQEPKPQEPNPQQPKPQEPPSAQPTEDARAFMLQLYKKYNIPMPDSPTPKLINDNEQIYNEYLAKSKEKKLSYVTAEDKQNKLLLDMYNAELILHYYHTNQQVIENKHEYDSQLSDIYEDIGIEHYTIQLAKIIEMLESLSKHHYSLTKEYMIFIENINLIKDIFVYEMLEPKDINEIYINISKIGGHYQIVEYITYYICKLYGIESIKKDEKDMRIINRVFDKISELLEEHKHINSSMF